MADIYYKGLLAGMVSNYDNDFRYHMGINIHPSPDKSSELCSRGIHLARSLKVAQRIVPRATEFFTAEAGVIYAEDSEKVRCGSCVILKRLTDYEIAELTGNLPEYLKLPNPLCGIDWLKKHGSDVTLDDYNKQQLVIKQDDKTIFTLKAGINKKDLKTVLSSIQK